MINVVKIGGNVVDDPIALNNFIVDFASLPGKKILVHGGGKEATALSKALGIETTMIDGRRVTDARTLDVVTMVYAGLINKRIVSLLQKNSVDAIGLCGADAHALVSRKRSPLPVDYGFVGDVDGTGVNVGLIWKLLEDGITPVFCAITLGDNGELLNTNADSVASAIAMGMADKTPTCLTFCFEKAGVLMDPSDEASVIPHITREQFDSLREAGVIAKGMVPKLTNSFNALDHGVKSVVIKSSLNLRNDIGTLIER